MSENCILAGPIVSELWWEFERFAPYVFWEKQLLEKQYKDISLIVLTRPDRFDIWGKHASILVPLRIKGDGQEHKPDCFRLTNFPQDEVEKIIENFYFYFSTMFNIIRHIYPKTFGNQFANKGQFPKNQRLYEYVPRSENKVLIDDYIKTDKPIITLASRFRLGLKRNWPHWQELYNLISFNKYLMNNFTFVICGKDPDYVKDDKDRFYDINKIKLGDNSSLIGLTIEVLKRSILTVGSQSGIPNISLLLGIEALEWGDQKVFHTITYNVKKTPVTFIEDMKYSIPAREVVLNITKMVKEKKHGTK